jgi:Lrp/AsnC family transcriptional regulator for asnA, asnC and gidA
MASGGFDLFVEVFCRDMDHFVSFLNQKLQQVPGLQRTETFMILKMYKLSYHWGEAEPPRTNHRPRIDLQDGEAGS